jgi:hypothetical protein
MSEADGPKFLSSAPVAEPPVTASPYRKPEPPRVSAPIPTIAAPPPVRKPAPEPEVSHEAEFLAHALGPGRMPAVMMRYPRIVGLVLLAFGVWLGRDLFLVATEGGFYTRSQPILAPAFSFLGAYFVIFGRPADADGYSPGWWNAGYVGMILAAFVAGFAIRYVYLA